MNQHEHHMKSSFNGYWGGVKSTFLFIFGLLILTSCILEGSWVFLGVGLLIGGSLMAPLVLDAINKKDDRDIVHDFNLDERQN